MIAKAEFKTNVTRVGSEICDVWIDEKDAGDTIQFKKAESVNITESKKQYPNIKKLEFFGKYYSYITIPNEMFPNLEEIVFHVPQGSYGYWFDKESKCLIKHDSLWNCWGKGDVLVLPKGVRRLEIKYFGIRA